METQEILIKILELLDKQNCVISDLVWNSEDTNFQYDIIGIVKKTLIFNTILK